MKWLIQIVVVLGLVAASFATTTSVTGCTATTVQAAVTAASNGDTILLTGAATCSWSTGAVVIPSSVGITINGQGTTLSAGGFTLNQGAYTTTITGFTFKGQTDDIVTSGSPTSAPFRIYSNNFSNTGQSIFIETYGNAPGLIDHNAFNGGAASEMIHNMAMGSGSTAGWVDDVLPGGPNMLFIENNTFTFNASGNPAYFYGTSAVQSYYGARTVMRYNTLNMCQFDQHGTAGMVGARWWEIYNNTFNLVANANQSTYMALRAGSGVIYNNHLSGTNGATGYISLYEEDTGYPALYQIGRGINQNLSPAYVWGNDAGLNVGSGSSNVVQGRDFMLSTSQPSSMVRDELAADTSTTLYNYTPYTYPHPLTSGGGVTSYNLTVNQSTGGTITGAACVTGSYPAGTQITCTATPSTGYTMGMWTGSICSGSGSVCTFPINASVTVGAQFNVVAPTTGGHVFGKWKSRQRR